MLWWLVGVYGLFVLVSTLNLLLMRRPGTPKNQAKIVVLIPARNEEANLRRLLPLITPQATVYVFDDDSDDGTGQVALECGAKLIRATGPLPEGWTGKNHACHLLAESAIEDSDADWLLFLDADTTPSTDFISGMASLIRPGCSVVTGFPQMLSGKGLEPLALAWVPWSLLVTTVYPVRSRFTNGQVVMWRTDVYSELWPHQKVMGRVLEDIAIGRLLAKEGLRVEVANLSSVLAMRMYETWRQAVDGMSKNAFEVTGNAFTIALLALLMLLCAWGWVFAWPTLGLLMLSGLIVSRIVRGPVWTCLFMPLALSVAAFVLLRSIVWRRAGRVEWKGRTY